MSNVDIEKANIGQVVGPASAVCRECLCAPPLPLPKKKWTHFSLPPTPLALAEDSIAAICKANVPRNAATHASFEISIAIGGYASGCLHCTRTASEFTLHVSLKLNRTSAHIEVFMYILHGVYIYIYVCVGGVGGSPISVLPHCGGDSGGAPPIYVLGLSRFPSLRFQNSLGRAHQTL